MQILKQSGGSVIHRQIVKIRTSGNGELSYGEKATRVLLKNSD